ncbi:MAG: hypothetical protein VX640_12030 [Pseudomonadota bacterium]|nr:hypothetical protein [Pseudomonadota bacterium]
MQVVAASAGGAGVRNIRLFPFDRVTARPAKKFPRKPPADFVVRRTGGKKITSSAR